MLCKVTLYGAHMLEKPDKIKTNKVISSSDKGWEGNKQCDV